MAAPFLDPLVCKIHQTTATLSRATDILRSAFPQHRLIDAIPGGGNPVVQLPRRDVPTYILPNQRPQPWELLPMKAAAMAQYPNFFNNSCVFFGSLKRDVLNGLPFCLVRSTRLAIDLAKVVRNLGIVDGFEIVQRPDRLRAYDFVWTPDQPEPNDIYDVALFPHRRIRLHLRTDMFSLRPAAAACASQSGSPASAAAAATAVQPPRLPLSAQLAPALGLLPLSVKNISKASQPVLMYPRQMEAARQRLPAGILLCYHHELGLITDAVAELYDVPALVAAHVGLPMSHVAQIRGALRLKAAEEAGRPLGHVTPLKSWNMVEIIGRRVAERQAALQAPSSGAIAVGSGSKPLEVARRELLEAARAAQQRARQQLSVALDTAIELEDGLLAHTLLRSGALTAQGAEEAGGGGGLGGGPVGGPGWTDVAAGAGPAGADPSGGGGGGFGARDGGLPAAAGLAAESERVSSAISRQGQQGRGQADREQRFQQRQRNQSRQRG